MTTVDAADAAAGLPRLLERVANNERVVITAAGRPVAELVPATDAGPAGAAAEVSAVEAVRQMLAIRDRIKASRGGRPADGAHDDHRY